MAQNHPRVEASVEIDNERGHVPEARLPKGLHNNFIFDFFNAVMFQSFGPPVILFIRQSGASAFIVGSLSAIPLLLMPLSLSASQLVEQVGYRRTAITSWTLRWAGSSFLILLALVSWPGLEPFRVTLVLVIIFLFHLFRNFGVSAYFPWISLIVPASRRGLYLSRSTVFANLGGVLAFLVIGLMLGNSPALSDFAPVFALGALGGLGSTIFLMRIKPPPLQPKKSPDPDLAAKARISFKQGLRNAFATPGFKSFLVVQTFYGIAFFAIPSLSLIYLREKAGIPPGTILFFSMAGVVGATISSLFWGNWIDRRGIYSLQLLAFLGLCINSIFWFSIGLFGANEINLLVAAVVTFFSAVWVSALNMSQTHSVMALAPVGGRVLFQNISTLMTLLSQALAPMLWGILLDNLDHNKFVLYLGGLEVSPYRAFFVASLIFGLIGAVFLLRLNRMKSELPLEDVNM